MFSNYYFFGMHLVWWLLWATLLTWVFVLPYDIPGQRKKKDSPLDILKKRLASGQITNEEFLQKKNLIDHGTTK